MTTLVTSRFARWSRLLDDMKSEAEKRERRREDHRRHSERRRTVPAAECPHQQHQCIARSGAMLICWDCFVDSHASVVR